MYFLVKNKKDKTQNNPVIVSYFALCFTARPRNFSESLNACLRLIRFSFVRYFRSFIHLTERRSALRSDTMSYHYISVSFLFRSFANSKTLAAIVSKNIRCSFSDNAVTSGAPTVTTSSFVFSIFITSSRLFFEGQKNTPHYLGSKTAKSKGLIRKFYNFLVRRLFLGFSTSNHTWFFASNTSMRRYTLPYQNRYCRDTAPYVKVYKPPICKRRRHTRHHHSKIAARGNTGGSPSGSAATARSRAL